MVALAHPISSVRAVVDTCLAVLADQQTWLIPVGQVADVCFVGPINPVPGWPPCFPGNINRGGLPCALLDLAAFLGRPAIKYHACLAAVFVRLPKRQPLQLGLIVDHLPRLIELPAKTINLTHKGESDSHVYPAIGTARIGDINAAILDLDQLFQMQSRIAPILRPAPPPCLNIR